MSQNCGTAELEPAPAAAATGVVGVRQADVAPGATAGRVTDARLGAGPVAADPGSWRA